MSSALTQTLIGAVAAIVGGLGAALWQTTRADDVARRIRRAERREQALIDLNAVVTVIYGQLLALYRRAEGGQNAAQHNEARQMLDRLTQHWDSHSSGIISDPSIVTAYAYFNAAVQEDLPGAATLQRVQELSLGERAAGQRFLRDLGHVVGTLDELKKAVHEQVELLDTTQGPRRVMSLKAVARPRRIRPPLSEGVLLACSATVRAPARDCSENIRPRTVFRLGCPYDALPAGP